MEDRTVFIANMKKRITQTIDEKFPIVSEKYSLDLVDVYFIDPKETTIAGELALKQARGTLEGEVRATMVIKDAENEIVSSKEVVVTTLPYPSLRGTFIIDGNEKIVQNQNVSKNGIFTTDKGPNASKMDIRLKNLHGSVEVDDKKVKVTFDKKNFSGVKFLTYLGLTSNEINAVFGGDAYGRRLRTSSAGGKGSLNDLFNSTARRAGSKATTDEGKLLAIQEFFNGSIATTGEEKETLKGTLGVSNAESVDLDVVKVAFKKVIDVARGTAKEDDRDDLVYQYVKNPEDLINEAFEKGIKSFTSSARNTLKGQHSAIGRYSVNVGKIKKNVKDFFTGDARVSDSDQTNPLLVLTEENSVTSGGPGGLPSEAARNNPRARNLKTTGLNRLDPVHTPESGKIGLTLRLSQDAKVQNGTITTKVLGVARGKAEDSENNTFELTPSEEYNAVIAFNSPRDVDHTGKSYTFKSRTVPGRHKGVFKDVSVEQVQYLDRRPQNLFGMAANMIPYGSHNDGNRMLMGANMQTQAMNLTTREEAMVQVSNGEGKTYEEVMGEKSHIAKAPVSGKVVDVQKDKISLETEDGEIKDVEIYDYFPLNRSNYINSEPVVKVGDNVKEGDLIAEGWQTRNGKLSLGLNTRVGYMPFKGLNFEDSVAVSESYANRVQTEDIIKDTVVIHGNYVGGTGSGAKKLARQFLNSTKSMENLDADGIIKEGSEIKPGDLLVVRLSEQQDEELNVESGLLKSLMGNKTTRYSDKSHAIPDTSYTKGKVIRVTKIPGGKTAGDKETITVEILTKKTLKPSDKISGRHGNKGTISMIIPDAEMPKTEDGKPLDLIFSPLAVPSRKNLGQLMEVNSGLIAEVTGENQIIENFDPNAKDKVLKKLEEIGVPDGKVTLINPDTGKPYENKVTVGNMYVMKLKHKVDDKIQARSSYEGKNINMKYLSPQKSIGEAAGEKHNPQSLGEMEIRALQAHKAVDNLLETTTLKGDGAGDAKARADIFRVLSGSADPSTLSDLSATPQSLRVFRDYAQALGMKTTALRGKKELNSIDDNFDGLAISAFKDSDLIKTIGKDNEVLEGTQHKITKKNVSKAEKGGLYDTEIFGDPDVYGDEVEAKKVRNNWGYIKLNTPVINPAFEQLNNPYTALTGLKAKDYEKLTKKGTHVLITNPGDTGLGLHAIIPATEADELEFAGKVFEYEVGADAIKNLLSEVNVKKDLRNIKKELKEVTSSAKRDELFKKYSILDGLNKSKLEATDLINGVVPVAPVYLRPRKDDGKDVVIDDLTTLYANVLKANEGAAQVVGKDVIDFSTAEDKARAYRSVNKKYRELIGVDRAKDWGGNEIKGLKQLLAGDKESKRGLVRSKMISKKVDYSGRSVIGVDPTLKLNQAALPVDMAKYMYKPFILKAMVDKGMARNTKEATTILEKDITDPKVMKLIQGVVKDRPVMLNRAPTLHKLSIQAFDPVVKDFDNLGNPIRAIHLNPLIVGPFNADFDGDQMAAHVPLTEAARKEAIKLMKPTENMINPANGELVIEIKHEMIQGIYYLTSNSDNPIGEAVTYPNSAAVLAAYKKGDIKTHSKVTVGSRTTTAGQFIFNSVLPTGYKRWNVLCGNKEIKAMMKEMYDDKNISKIQLSNIFDGLKEIGFLAATYSGMSIGIKDFSKPEKVERMIDETLESIDKELANDPSAYTAKYRELEEAIEGEYNRMAKEDTSNPLHAMMASGARGSAGQIRRMAATVGVGRDMLENYTLPVKSSHLEGLMPQEYYLHSYDSRKGLSDRALGTAKPGEITRNLWASVQDQLITENDCGTKRGIKKAVDETIIGRFAAESIPGIVSAGKIIKQSDYDKMVQEKITQVMLRSPMTCESRKGTCKKCYGAMPGTMELPDKGEPIGIVATQSLGEPITQMTMNTFHSGGTNSNATMGIPRINEIISASSDFSNKAVIAESSGVVQISIDEENNSVVNIGGKEHIVKAGVPVKVKDGEYLNKGDFITFGGNEDYMDSVLMADKNFVMPSVDPNTLLRLNRDKGEADALTMAKQSYANSLDYAVAKTLNTSMGSKIDSRHLEVIADKMGDKVKVIDGGDSSYMPGQYISRKEADAWNTKNSNNYFDGDTYDINKRDKIIGAKAARDIKGRGGMLARKGEIITQDMYGQFLIAGLKDVRVFPKPIRYEGEISGLQTSYHRGNNNWFSDMGSDKLFMNLGSSAVQNKVDDLSDPRGRQMAGLLQPLGAGFEKVKDFSNSFGKTLMGMFK